MKIELTRPILENSFSCGRSQFYPNCLLGNYDVIVSPYDEKVMSLNRESFYDGEWDPDFPKEYTVHTDPVFFFCYNFENYYHFLYDTLSYIVHYKELKTRVPKLKLLVGAKKFYEFNIEMFDLLGLNEDLVYISPTVMYSTIHMGLSLTKGNAPPDPRVFDLFKFEKNINNFSKKFYISRRSHIHGDLSNMGTDYTSRRRLINEDALVEYLTSKGYEEVFCEKMSMKEKINLFSNATDIVGCIGGGMANLLFSPPETNVWCIVSPEFLKINYRFRFCMEHTNIRYITDTSPYSDALTLHTRVVMPDGRIGEITKIKYEINISNNDVAGFSREGVFEQGIFSREELVILDKGLNSPYVLDLDKKDEYGI